MFDPEEKAICVCRNPADKPVTPSQPDPHTNWQSICRLLFSCLQKDKTWACIVPLCLISSSLCYLWCWAGLRSAHWWWTGDALGQCLCDASTLCQPLPVPASAVAAPPRFSARKPDWTVCFPPDMGLIYSFIHVTHSLLCIIYDFLVHNIARFAKTLSVWCNLWNVEIHLFVPMTPPQHFILALPMCWGRVWNRNRRVTLWSIYTVKLNPIQEQNSSKIRWWYCSQLLNSNEQNHKNIKSIQSRML